MTVRDDVGLKVVVKTVVQYAIILKYMHLSSFVVLRRK